LHVVAVVPKLAPTEVSRRWAALLQQIFEVDPLMCPHCAGAMRIVAFITQSAVIDQMKKRAAKAPGGEGPVKKRKVG